MDPKFQSSFIPRKSAVDAALPSRTAVGIFTLVTVALFVVAVALAGVLFLWKQTLVSGNENLKSRLEEYQVKLTGPNIQELINLNDRIAVASSHLNTHVAMSNIFNVISEATLQNIQWKSFSLEYGDQGDLIISMAGLAKGFADVALQSDKVLADKNFVNPLFSDVSLGTNDEVSFSLKTSLNPKLISYKELVKGKAAVEIPSSDTPITVETSTTTASTTPNQ